MERARPASEVTVAPSTMRSSKRERPGEAAAANRIKLWTRERFRLPNDAAILVSEVACTLPGCPPLETIIAFWTDKNTRHHFKVFKPLAEVVEDDRTGLGCC
jgi:hypothetical protein